MHLAAGFVLINLSPGWIRPRRVIRRQWGIVVVSYEGVALAKAIVENAPTETKHRFWRMRGVSGAGRPGNRDARCKVQLAPRVVLNFVTQTVADSQVGLVPPVVLNIRFDV